MLATDVGVRNAALNVADTLLLELTVRKYISQIYQLLLKLLSEVKERIFTEVHHGRPL